MSWVDFGFTAVTLRIAPLNPTLEQETELRIAAGRSENKRFSSLPPTYVHLTCKACTLARSLATGSGLTIAAPRSLSEPIGLRSKV